MKLFGFILISSIVVVAIVSARPADSNTGNGGTNAAAATGSGTGTDSVTGQNPANGQNQGSNNAPNQQQGNNNGQNSNVGGNRERLGQLIESQIETLHEICRLMRHSLFPGFFPSNNNSGLQKNGLNNGFNNGSN